MPIPVTGEDWASTEATGEKDLGGPSNAAANSSDKTPNAYLSVALQAFEPRFDPMVELWYFDVALRTGPLAFPRVRLGLVRYQPNAREDDVPPEGSEPVRLRVSTPVTEWVKPLPGRRATATCQPRANGWTEIGVVVDGPSAYPDDNKNGVQPNMLVELIRHKSSNGLPSQEEIAIAGDGNPALYSDWSSKDFNSSARGLIHRLRGVCSWTCIFVIPGPLEDN